VGILGGTFDPPHIGHVVAAAWARDALGLDEVRLMVANDPWQKTQERPVTPAAIRLEMVQRALEGTTGLAASDLEIRRGGVTYMVDTLRAIRRQEPGVELFVVLGADAAAGLATWHRWEELPALATFVVVGRSGVAAPDRALGDAFSFAHVEIPALAVTSTLIRGRVEAGRSIDGLTPAGVSSLVVERGLYRGEVHERPTAL
jgi:nicotinate-nucleotide adenylyltransferase